MEKYFPQDAREKREIEFLALTQGSMTVSDYATRFEELARYHSHYRNAVDDRPRCVKFISGLRPEIKEAVRLHDVRNFTTLVNMCRVFEEDHQERVA